MTIYLHTSNQDRKLKIIEVNYKNYTDDNNNNNTVLYSALHGIASIKLLFLFQERNGYIKNAMSLKLFWLQFLYSNFKFSIE